MRAWVAAGLVEPSRIEHTASGISTSARLAAKTLSDLAREGVNLGRVRRASSTCRPGSPR